MVSLDKSHTRGDIMEIERSNERIKDISAYYRKELDRVLAAVDDAKRRLSEIEKGITTKDKAAKAGELMLAIKVGDMYITALRKKLS